jgi:uncharacterized repeat protein (TIGR03806 family)
MHDLFRTAAVTAAAAALAACGGGSSGGGNANGGNGSGPQPSPPANRVLGLDARPTNSTCTAPARSGADAGAVAVERVFASLDLEQPLAMLQAPGDDSRWFVLEKPGRIRVFADDPDVAGFDDDFIDLDAHFDVNDISEGGLLGLAFDPAFADNGLVYVSWTEGSPMVSVVARFTSHDRLTLDPASRQDVIRLEQDFGNHNGGHVAFGPDGYLYIGFGDGGSGGDPNGRAQDTTNLLGAFLRIDVGGAAPYGIPADNPFAGNPLCSSNPNVSGANCPEIYAWGLRNPWRWSFDAETGALWAGDVGQASREEIDVIERGGNYGWNCREGAIEFPGTPAAACSTASGLVDPVHDYPRSDGSSVTGGYVYRGTAMPALIGDYLFADYGSGRLWRLTGDGAGGHAAELLLDTGLAIASFGEGLDGELYAVDIAGGGLYRIEADDAADESSDDAADGGPGGAAGASNSPVAAKLSETGCVDSADPRLPADGLIPYEVAAPFWSDGAQKERWLAIPDGTTVAVTADGDFEFPAGAVTMKHFRVDGELVETRLFMRHPDGGWAGYSYRWNAQQTDAERVDGGAVADVGGRQWIFPSGNECMSCHTSAAGFTLGLEAVQLDHDFTYPSTGRSANQLDTLDGIALFESPLPARTEPGLTDPYDTAAALEDRARAYLHTNCAQCHRGAAAMPSDMDLRARKALADTKACDAPPTAGDVGLGPAARIIAPGDPDASVMQARIERRDAHGMPPLATSAVDETGAALLREWIASLDGCG